MENASVITYAGDLKLFEEFESALVQAIPKEPSEWRRPYGRAVKSVYIDASFVPFSKDTVPKLGNLKLIAQPILHTYWTECNDIDTYKNSVKNDIEYWLKQIGSADWMIILVEVYDIKKSNKMILRTTVLDKIKTDFGVKQGDRVLSLIHPIKSESKSAESWRGLINRIRTHTLSAYNKTLSTFEEGIRSNRECRPLPTWSFCSYFNMQEELALVFEMLGLYEEALVQYDELDALFTQFVLNSTKGDTPKWLSSFSVPLQQWAGPTLCQRVTPGHRELLRCSKLDLLQFRSYLFGRQCSLLILQNKPWEVAKRTASFLHNSVLEMKILEVSAPDGSIATWVFLVSLEILQVCEKFTESSQVEAYSVHTAGLWSYAREKLKYLGTLCGLAPGPGPTSGQLHIVVQLSSGMGDPPPSSVRHSPVDRLKQALSSKENYNNYFMELSELAISTYKHIGRMRFARLAGMELADLYLSLKQPDKAATFLSATLQGLQDDKWANLASSTQLRLVRCFSDTQPDIRYATCCAAIASSGLIESTKIEYYNKLIKTLELFAQGTSMVTSLNGIGNIEKIEINSRHQIYRGQCVVQARLKFNCVLPGPLVCTSISISVERGTTESSQIVDEIPQEVFKRLTILEHVDYKQDGSLNGTNIICQEPQKALKRTDSQGRGRKISTPFRRDFTHCLTTRNYILQPGVNYIDLTWTAKNTGRHLLGQLSIAVPGLEFLESVSSPTTEFIIDQQKSSVQIKVCEKELLAGLPQQLEIILDAGSHFILEGTPLVVSCSSGLLALNSKGVLESSIEITLSETEPFQSITLPLSVHAELPAQSDGDPAINHQVTVSCGWCDTESVTCLSFLTPLRSVMRLHSVSQRKILQITMTGLTNTHLRLRNPQLHATGINIQSKNDLKGQSKIIGAGLKVSLMWELDVSSLSESLESIPLSLIVEYSPVTTSTTKPVFYTYKCHFGIFNFKTLFVVKYSLEAGKEAEFCKVGAICQLHLDVTRCDLKNTCDIALMYEVHADQTMWAICGRSAGVMTFDKDVQQSIVLDVIPQTQGYLPLPNIRLCRYIPALNKECGKPEDSKARLEQFSPGQVYFGSKSAQVHILPAATD